MWTKVSKNCFVDTDCILEFRLFRWADSTTEWKPVDTLAITTVFGYETTFKGESALVLYKSLTKEIEELEEQNG